jgi:predicted metalloprotease with PDZ domain
MYVVGQERQPAGVTLDLPREWRVATALEGTADHRVFRAPDIHALVESPIFAGRFHDWAFSINRVLHRVVYWPAPGAASFDTTAFVAGIERLVRQAVALFGGPPYRDYTFIFQDAAYGGLEHPSSVTLGVTSQDLARDPHSSLEETAHEFFHTWNLMRIRPEEYQGVTWRTQPPTAGLWFSEGLTIYYADLLRRRAGLPLRDSSRQEHLESVLEQYLASPGNAVFSAESISKVEYNAGPGALGDYSASSHLVGEVLGTLLDIAIRQATQGARSMDDVMRLMLERHSGDRGFNGRDIEETVEEVCRCDVSPLFDRHVRGGGDAVDFDRYLAPLGWRAAVEWQPATWDNQPERDLRIWGWVPDGEDAVRLIVTNPESIWGRAGLHTLDRLVSINAVPVRSWPELRGALVRSRMGDTLVVEVMRDAGPFRATVMVAGFNRPSVRIVPVPGASAAQVRLREQWLAGS